MARYDLESLITSHSIPSIWYLIPLTSPCFDKDLSALFTFAQEFKSIKKSTTSFNKVLLPIPLMPIRIEYIGFPILDSNSPTLIRFAFPIGDNTISSSIQNPISAFSQSDSVGLIVVGIPLLCCLLRLPLCFTNSSKSIFPIIFNGKSGPFFSPLNSFCADSSSKARKSKSFLHNFLILSAISSDTFVLKFTSSAL